MRALKSKLKRSAGRRPGRLITRHIIGRLELAKHPTEFAAVEAKHLRADNSCDRGRTFVIAKERQFAEEVALLESPRYLLGMAGLGALDLALTDDVESVSLVTLGTRAYWRRSA